MAFAAVQNPHSDNRFVYNQFFCVCGFSSKHIISFKSQRRSFYILEIRLDYEGWNSDLPPIRKPQHDKAKNLAMLKSKSVQQDLS